MQQWCGGFERTKKFAVAAGEQRAVEVNGGSGSSGHQRVLWVAVSQQRCWAEQRKADSGQAAEDRKHSSNL